MATIAASLLAGYAIMLAAAYLGQRWLIYPRRGTGAAPVLSGATLERIPNGEDWVYALFSRATEPTAPTLVHFHGNGEELADVVDLVALFTRHGIGVYSVEYPGYGLARGSSPTEAALYQAAEAALHHLVERERVAPERIVLFGQSLGSGVAVEMARRGHGQRVVLFSPYTSVADVADEWLPILPNRLLVRDRFDNAGKAPSIRKPVLVVHGTEDEIIPFRLGKALAGLFPDARLVEVERGRHNDLFARGGDVLDEVVSFCRGGPTRAEHAGSASP